MPKLRFYSNEKVITLPGKSSGGLRYALTSYGKFISYDSEIEEGRILKLVKISGYPAISIRIKGKIQTYLIHRLMAKYFLDKPTARHNYVIHLNYKKDDNFIQNLKWVTHQDRVAHNLKFRMEKEIGNYKLTAERVQMIKRKLLNGKTRLKMIARQFGVSDMQIHRIKTGENWSHVKI
jgi:hypothetical protein